MHDNVYFGLLVVFTSKDFSKFQEIYVRDEKLQTIQSLRNLYMYKDW